jgi:hypothetical protein
VAAIISFIFGAIELLLGLRFVFLLLGANPMAPFVLWVYNTSNPIIVPFAGILGRATTAPTGVVVHGIFDPSTLIALIICAAVGGILVALFGH